MNILFKLGCTQYCKIGNQSYISVEDPFISLKKINHQDTIQVCDLMINKFTF